LFLHPGLRSGTASPINTACTVLFETPTLLRRPVVPLAAFFAVTSLVEVAMNRGAASTMEAPQMDDTQDCLHLSSSSLAATLAK
jgi:hypothetical protein